MTKKFSENRIKNNFLLIVRIDMTMMTFAVILLLIVYHKEIVDLIK